MSPHYHKKKLHQDGICIHQISNFKYITCNLPFTLAVLGHLYKMASSPNTLPGPICPSTAPSFITLTLPSGNVKKVSLVNTRIPFATLRQKDKVHFLVVLNMLQSIRPVQYPLIYTSELLSTTE